MTPDKKGMTSYIAFRNPVQVKLADNRALYAYGKGTVNISVFDGARKVNLALHDVLYVPKIRNKLMPLPSTIEKGAEEQFKGQFCEVIINDKMYRIWTHAWEIV